MHHAQKIWQRLGDFEEIDEGVFRGSVANSQRRVDLLSIIGKTQKTQWHTTDVDGSLKCISMQSSLQVSQHSSQHTVVTSSTYSVLQSSAA